MWTELHGLLRSATEVHKTQGEAALGFVVINFVGSVLAVTFYLTQEDWKPGLLSIYAVLTLFAMLVSPLPLLFKGFLLNLSIARQVRLLTELHLEVSRMICYSETSSSPRARLRSGSSFMSASPVDEGSSKQLQKIVHAVCLGLEQDGRNGFRLLGVPLTLQGLGSIASTVFALASFAAKKLHLVQILKQHLQ